VRQRVTATFNYALPFGESKRGFTGVLVKGWQANGLVVWNTGMPFSVTNTINRSGTRPSAGTSDRPNMIGSGKISHSSVSRWFDINDFAFQKVGTVGTERRNQLYGPGLQRVDLSLFKNLDITERLKFEFRAEAFNVFNTTQFSIRALRSRSRRALPLHSVPAATQCRAINLSRPLARLLRRQTPITRD
jgi:hypothetical protein